MLINKEQLIELSDLIEDTLEYFCDTEQVSGELAWTCLAAMSIAKAHEFPQV